MVLRVLDFLPLAVKALTEQLEEDEKVWKDAWLKYPKKGQEDRIYQDYARYYTEWLRDGKPIPWLKIMGNALIAWIREQHPELFPDGKK